MFQKVFMSHAILNYNNKARFNKTNNFCMYGKYSN